jgi:3-deoxy-D-manno-octulosonate 8-phosphate phosphatase (KDO 8-P phosphatase)
MKRNKNTIHIKLFIMDVDGVLTDGKVYYTDDGMCFRGYHMHDGVFDWLGELGIMTALCSGKADGSIRHRAMRHKADFLLLGSRYKLQDVQKLLKKLRLSFNQVAYMGDDMADIPVMEKAALSFAPSNALPQVKKIADYVTKKEGGNGAVREVFEKYFVTR